MGSARIQVNRIAATVTIIVSARRSPMTSATGRFQSSDMPKLPWTIWKTHFAYWT